MGDPIFLQAAVLFVRVPHISAAGRPRRSALTLRAFRRGPKDKRIDSTLSLLAQGLSRALYVLAPTQHPGSLDSMPKYGNSMH
ncbi:hypothetical protein OE88DRAFT_1215617 [Heliocybe sulcata]|uniref:Uncharacterized protein n=1 Tax=Heliocybe sulcata TaxID=5364 RepID=A0A5C3MMZ7_9AGAM|nr:hypothetical protein OE88DRAFT_1215617 [Heliocybe sulcata]